MVPAGLLEMAGWFCGIMIHFWPKHHSWQENNGRNSGYRNAFTNGDPEVSWFRLDFRGRLKCNCMIFQVNCATLLIYSQKNRWQSHALKNLRNKNSVIVALVTDYKSGKHILQKSMILPWAALNLNRFLLGHWCSEPRHRGSKLRLRCFELSHRCFELSHRCFETSKLVLWNFDIDVLSFGIGALNFEIGAKNANISKVFSPSRKVLLRHRKFFLRHRSSEHYYRSSEHHFRSS